MLLWGLEHLKGVLELSPLDAERRCTWKGGPVQTQNLFYLYPAKREQLSLSLLLCLPVLCQACHGLLSHFEDCFVFVYSFFLHLKHYSGDWADSLVGGPELKPQMPM